MLHIYLKNQDGTITSIGHQGFASKAEAVDYYNPTGFIGQPYIAEMLGWPHTQCEWYGSVGFGVPV